MISALAMSAAVFTSQSTLTWSRVANLPFSRMEGSLTSVGDNQAVYLGGSTRAAGNDDPATPVASAALYSSSGNRWSALPDMKYPRDSPGSCTIGGTVYAFGGTVKFPTPGQQPAQATETATAEAIDVAASGVNANAWRSAPSLPSPRTSPSATSLPNGTGCIIAAGFEATSGSYRYLNDAYLFDGKTYKPLPSLPYSRSNMGIVATGDGVYVIGGGETEPSYFNVSYLRLSPAVAGSWTPLAPLKEARSWAMIGAVTDPSDGKAKLVAAGGMSLNPMFEPMASVEVYSFAKNEWTLMPAGTAGALPTPVGFGSGIALNATHMLAAGGAGEGDTGKEVRLAFFSQRW